VLINYLMSHNTSALIRLTYKLGLPNIYNKKEFNQIILILVYTIFLGRKGKCLYILTLSSVPSIRSRWLGLDAAGQAVQ